MKTVSVLTLLIAALLSSGCAQNAAQPPEVQAVYLPSMAANELTDCDAITAEMSALDDGLGGPVIDGPPRAPATAGARWGSYGKNLVLQSIMGPLQPVIQTVNAASNREDRLRLEADRKERAGLRRAYLRGLHEGASCGSVEATAESQ